LRELVPAGLFYGRGNEFGADVPLAQGFLVHGADVGCTREAPDGVLRAPRRQMSVNAIDLGWGFTASARKMQQECF
jgi:hypothetical protein